MALNPDKYIRAAILGVLEASEIPAWHKKIPKNVAEIPSSYVLLHSQTKRPTEIGKICYDWSCSIVLDITSINSLGFTSAVTVDDIEEIILDKISPVDGKIQIENFSVVDVSLLDSTEMTLETGTDTIDRKVMVYNFWLCNL